jgi:hypothetical protein
VPQLYSAVFIKKKTVFRRPVLKLHLRNASGPRDLFPSSPSDRYGDAGTCSPPTEPPSVYRQHGPPLTRRALLVHSSTFVRTKSLSVRYSISRGRWPREQDTARAKPCSRPRSRVTTGWSIFNPKEKRKTERSWLINKQSLQGPLIDHTANVRRFLCPFATCPVVYTTTTSRHL